MQLEDQVHLVTAILAGLEICVTFITEHVMSSVRLVMDQAMKIVSLS